MPTTAYQSTHTGAQIDAAVDAVENKANINSPAFTGTPTAPTAAANTDSTQIATTAFVQDVVEDMVSLGPDDGTGGIVDSETGQQVDISKYALKTWVQGQGYLTSHQDISGKANTADLADVATSGSYDDLSNQPDIPTALSELTSDATHRLVTDSEKTTWNGKQAALVSGTNIKTINNQSLLGSGNISISGGSGGGGDENVIEAITFNGAAVPVTDKTAAITASIPAEVTESTVSGWGFTKNTGTYSKPSGGIPATDLASAVQTSLGKADTALQSFTESDPVFTASAAHGIGSTDISNWNGKYTKPSGGIPKTDLAIAVQTSLGKADTALQNYTETDPTVPSWAKASSKPSYTASEVGAVPTTRTVNGKALSANVTLTASDVGAVDASGVVTIYSGSSTPLSSLGSNGDIYIKTS